MPHSAGESARMAGTLTREVNGRAAKVFPLTGDYSQQGLALRPGEPDL